MAEKPKSKQRLQPQKKKRNTNKSYLECVEQRESRLEGGFARVVATVKVDAANAVVAAVAVEPLAVERIVQPAEQTPTSTCTQKK